jgi:hypothetical protein
VLLPRRKVIFRVGKIEEQALWVETVLESTRGFDRVGRYRFILATFLVQIGVSNLGMLSMLISVIKYNSTDTTPFHAVFHASITIDHHLSSSINLLFWMLSSSWSFIAAWQSDSQRLDS